MKKSTIGLILIGLVGLALLGSGIGKLVNSAEMATQFGSANRAIILAIIEFAVLGALALPATRKLGIILAASYFGGAIAFSWLAENEMPIPGIVVNVLLYVGAVLYYPSLADGKAGVAGTN
ncbi:MAG: hypothetical protein AAF597_02275 [Bacteroidota bacterium]